MLLLLNKASVNEVVEPPLDRPPGRVLELTAKIGDVVTLTSIHRIKNLLRRRRVWTSGHVVTHTVQTVKCIAPHGSGGVRPQRHKIMTTKTRTTTTIHGEVKYETVECSSCQSEVRKDDAFGFVIYDTDRVKTDREWHDHYEWKVYDGGYTTGYACEYCRGNGPIEYPTAKPIRKATLSGLSISPMGLLCSLIPIVGIYCAVDMIIDPPEDGAAASGVIGLMAQVVAAGVIVGLLLISGVIVT